MLDDNTRALVIAADVHRQVHAISKWTRDERRVWQDYFGVPVYTLPRELKRRADEQLRAALAPFPL